VGESWASALQSGVLIDVRQSFDSADDLMYDVQQGSSCTRPHSYGFWVAVQQRYLGLEFQINGETHYGWAELSTNGYSDVNTLYGFAYETIPFKGIVTGQTMDSPDEPAINPGSAASPVMQGSMVTPENPSPDNKHKHHRYTVIDIGTFGGPNSFVPTSFLNEVGSRVISDQGTVAGVGDTSVVDPLCFFDDCFYPNAFQWRRGALVNLGTLPGSQWGAANGISGNGLIVGASENGETDPLSGFPEFRAVLWNRGRIGNLGTLEGGYESAAFAVNNRGQVVGFATNTVPDPFSFFPPTQTRAFLSQNGVMRDLGTLGGPDAWAFFVNERGQVAGESYTNSIPNSSNGFCSPNVPTQDPFIWDNGRMIDLGTLGGTCGLVNALNNQGQVVGVSNLAGDVTLHPFFWDHGVLRDLGTLGGNNGQATWINDAGDVVGEADLLGSQTHDAFLWKHGVMTDLGNLGQTSFAYANNSEGQVVGHSLINDGTFRAFLWEDRGPMIDLNTLIAPGSGLTLTDAIYINNRGEIAGNGVLANGDQHAFLLIPCDDQHPGQCEDYSMIEVATSQTGAPTRELPTVKQDTESPVSPVERFRNMMRRRYHIPGQPAAPRD
jgi:probable HAF family extracellular repeat protein